MSTPQPDPGHLLPPDEWQRVVEEAEREAERIERGERPLEAPPEEHGRTTGLLALSGVVTAARHGGNRGNPRFGVLHAAETPLRAGYAASIARMFATTTDDKSCHYMTDPAETWGVLPDELLAWHCGTGNTHSIGLEQAGYASFTRAEWLTADGWAQMRRNAAIMRAAHTRYGIGLYWMTDQQLRDAHAGRIVGGWATHDQCRRVLGGTTHTDPMPNYPLTEQMQLAIEGDDVLTDADKEWLKDWVGWEAFATMPTGPDAGKRVIAGVQLRDTYLRAQRIEATLVATQASVTALNAAVKALAAAKGADGEAILARVGDEVRAALEASTVKVDVNVSGEPALTGASHPLELVEGEDYTPGFGPGVEA